MLRLTLCLVASLAPAGCIIGTWPVPEETPDRAPPGHSLGEEACDGEDDDGDGSVDEGCACIEPARGCVGVVGTACGFGVQWCASGFWQECAELAGPWTPARTPEVRVLEIAPAALYRGDVLPVTLVVEPVPACEAIVVPEVEVSLVAAAPAMRVRGVARDDGTAPDAAADDGRFTVELPNPFGPGVPAQELRVVAAAELGEVDVIGAAVLPLEER
jgi:hypothetical protein